MLNNHKILIFLVDDDALFLKSLEIDFKQNPKWDIRMFATAESCIENLSENPDVIVLDYYLNDIKQKAINGLEALINIKTLNPEIPVIMLSSQDSIDVAVNCMKHKAFDYIVKSETAFIRLQKAISNFFIFQKMEKTLSWYMGKL